MPQEQEQQQQQQLNVGLVTDENALLVPSMHDPSRQTSRSSSVFSLVATLVGGGVLSLPYAIQQTGIVLGMLYLIGSGVLSAFSIQLLLACSRRTGAQSYEEVAEMSFGRKMKYATMIMLIIMTFMASVAYLILARDLGVPLVESYISGKKINRKAGNIVAIVSLIPVIPLCFAKTLHSLRFTSLASLLALLVLSVAILYRSIEHAGERTIHVSDLKWASSNLGDTFYALPFMQLSFMCHFNVLPVHTGLRKPTRRRLNHVVFFTILVASVFYVMVSLSGYFYAFDHHCGKHSSSKCKDKVADNILNVFDLKDVFIDIGRFGFLASLMLSFPLLVMPCRETTLALLEEMSKDKGKRRRPRRQIRQNTEDEIIHANGEGQEGSNHYVALTDEVETTTITEQEQHQERRRQEEQQREDVQFLMETPGEEDVTIIDSSDSPEFRTPMIRRGHRRRMRQILTPFKLCSTHGIEHVVITCCILILSVICVLMIPSVAVIWNLTGSTVGMALGFVFPTAFYIQIRSPNGFFSPSGKDWRLRGAWCLFVFSTVMGVICTWEGVKTALQHSTSYENTFRFVRSDDMDLAHFSCHISSHDITDGQPYHDTTCDVEVDSLEPDSRKEIRIGLVDVKAGRKNSIDTASNFFAGLDDTNYFGVRSNATERPDQLHFFVKGGLDFGALGYIEDIHIGQGEENGKDIWWVGGPSCKVSKSSLTCKAQKDTSTTNITFTEGVLYDLLFIDVDAS